MTAKHRQTKKIALKWNIAKYAAILAIHLNDKIDQWFRDVLFYKMFFKKQLFIHVNRLSKFVTSTLIFQLLSSLVPAKQSVRMKFDLVQLTYTCINVPDHNILIRSCKNINCFFLPRFLYLDNLFCRLVSMEYSSWTSWLEATIVMCLLEK